MNYVTPSQRGRAGQWTARHEYWTLLALNQSDDPSELPALYRRVRDLLQPENLLESGEDLEWRDRWTLSNAQKKDYSVDLRSGSGEWQITKEGRHWVNTELIDDDEVEFG